MRIDTRLVRAGLGTDPRTGAVSTPIHPSATFAHPGLGRSTGFDYSRTANPTRRVLEQALAEVEGGAKAFAFPSGMAALTTLCLLFRPGDHLVASDDLYGGTYRLFERVFREYGLEVTYTDTTAPESVELALRPNTRALLVENPTNPLLKVADLEALGRLARDRGLVFVVDSTFLTPYLQRPLELGADIVVHSATKFLGGHNDLLAGALVAREPEWAERIEFLHNTTGAVLDPFSSWLLVRSLKTLAVRVERQCRTAEAVARFLLGHPGVTRVYYPGLPDHPGREILERQARGFGAMVSFRLRSADEVPAFLERLRLVTFAESLGGAETLVTVPSRQTHCDMPPEVRERLGVTDDLVRLSVGLESPEDLIADLDRALQGETG
ncbi:MAG: PLP-dependent transferase [Deltaproteobacteria bacterium]|nr:PLP-dependent transferase [Deltaproteobacteria bacterium]